jgi:uncharacterized membrane protein YesL
LADFFGLFDHKSAGGVPEDSQKRGRVRNFFQIYFRKFWKLALLNLLYILFCIPIITIGPATAGIVKVLKNFSQETHSYVFSDFWSSFKKNFKQSFIVGIAEILIVLCILSGFIVYPSLAVQSGNIIWYIFFIIVASIFILLFIMKFYIYLMIVTTNIKLTDIIKNSFVLTFMEFKRNLSTAVIVIVTLIATTVLVIFYNNLLPFTLFGPLTTLWLLICYNCYPVIKKYVIAPYYEQMGEENPEDRLYSQSNSDEVLFKDMGAHEAKVEREKG